MTPRTVLATFLLTTTALVAAAGPASAATLYFTDQPTFSANTGATQQVFFPGVVNDVPSYTENGFTFSQAAGHGTFVGEWTPVLPGGGDGFEIAVSGPEHIDIEIAQPVFALGFFFQDGFNEGTNTNTDSCPQSDSKFTVSYFDGVTLIDSVNVDPALDEVFFWGVLSEDAPISRAEIREIGAPIDQNAGPHCENDFLGYVYASRTARPIPELPTFILGSLGLAGIGLFALVGRRRT